MPGKTLQVEGRGVSLAVSILCFNLGLIFWNEVSQLHSWVFLVVLVWVCGLFVCLFLWVCYTYIYTYIYVCIYNSIGGIIGGISYNKSHSKVLALFMDWDQLKFLVVSEHVWKT